MSNWKGLLRSLLLAATLVVPCGAEAQLFRAYLASDGLDTNPCTLPQPCRLLPAALAAVANGGEIWMLDSANYNASSVNIAKSVTILAVPGVVGSVVAISGPALNINTGGVSVSLTNLVILPFDGTGAQGILMNQGASLAIDGCTISRFLNDVAVQISTPAKVKVTNSLFRDDYTSLYVEAGSQVDISTSRFFLPPNGYGIYAKGSDPGPTLVAVTDTVLTGGYNGIAGWDTSATSKVRVTVTRTTLSNSSFGATASSTVGGSTVLAIGGSMVTGNEVGLNQQGAGSVMESLGNNLVRHNTNNNTQGTITPIPGT